MCSYDEQLEKLIVERNAFENKVKALESKGYVDSIENTAVRAFIHIIVESGQLSGEDTEFVKDTYHDFKLRK